MGRRWLVELRQRLGRGFGHVLAAMQPVRRNDGELLPGLYTGVGVVSWEEVMCSLYPGGGLLAKECMSGPLRDKIKASSALQEDSQ